MADLPVIEESQETAQIEAVTSEVFEGNLGPSNKDLSIGIGAFIVLLLVLLAVRGALINYLVSNLKRSPSSANLAGWCIYASLACLSAIISIWLVGSSFLTFSVLSVLSTFGVLFFILTVVTALKK